MQLEVEVEDILMVEQREVLEQDVVVDNNLDKLLRQHQQILVLAVVEEMTLAEQTMVKMEEAE
jgi:hypothetical protein